jgi:hypothetical protein
MEKPHEPIDNVEVSGDHYSYLEIEATYCPTNIPTGTLFLRHVDRDTSNEVLDVDADSPDVLRLEKPEKPPPVESNAETLVVQEPEKNSSKRPAEPTIKPSSFRRKYPRNMKQNEQTLLKSYFDTVQNNNADLSAKPKPQTSVKKKAVQRSTKKRPRRGKKGVRKTSRAGVDNVQEAESSDSDFGSRREPLVDDFSLLPEWVIVPYHDWILRNVTVSSPMKELDLKVVPTKGDGNCFYYCICESRVFQTKFPGVMDNVMEIREQIHAYTTENTDYGKLVYESNFFDIGYEKWLERIKRMGKHSSPAEMRLFARVLCIHVVSLMQSDVGTIFIGTYDSEVDYCKDRQLPIPTKPRLEDTIFVWHHYYEEPMNAIPYGAADDLSLGNPVNHYVLLEHRENVENERNKSDLVFNFWCLD